MTNEEITRQFLKLLAGYWDDPAIHRGFKELRRKISKQRTWKQIIEARLLVLEKKTANAVVLLEAILGKEPENYITALMLVRILTLDLRDSRKALVVLDDLLSRGFEGQVLPEWFEAITLGEKVYVLTKIKRFDEALATAVRLIDRFEGFQEPFLVRQVARALTNKGWVLGQQGKPEEAIQVCDDVARRFGDATEPDIQAHVARALTNKGWALGKQGKPEEKLQVYDDVVKRFGDATESGIREQVAKTLINKGVTLGKQGKPEEEIQVYDDVVKRFGDATEPDIQAHVARALLNKGVTLGQQGKPEEEIQVYDDVVKRFGDATEPGIQEQVARALLNKGVTLHQQGKPEVEIQAYDDVVKRFGDATEPGIQEQVARALLNKGVTLGQQGKPGEAIQVYDDVVKRFGDATELGIQERVAKTLINKGVTLGQQGKPEEEIQVYDDVVKRFGDATEPDIQEQAARALVYKGITLGQQGKPEVEIQVYDDVVKRFGAATEPDIQKQVARALTNKGVTLGQQGKPEEEIQVYDDVVKRFGDATEPDIQEQVARALVYKGWTLGQQGKPEEAIQAYDDVVKRFDESRDPSLRKWFFDAQLRKALTFLEMDQDKEARELFDSIQTELLKEKKIKEKLASLYSVVTRRFAHKRPVKHTPQHDKWRKRDLEITRKDVASHFEVILSHVLEEIDSGTQKKYFENMQSAQARTDRFITDDAHFSDDFSFILVLREWNSYTPVIPSAEESDRGGGYYIRHAGQGIVIDPGYDFIENFHRAGGRLNGIDHIIVTHAHDDHTAELEALLMLFQRRWANQDLQKKRLNLYLSAGVQRKFAGLLNLRDPKYDKMVTLCPSTNQRIPLNGKTIFTVLPAFHDDAITRDSAVGLGFEFDTEKGTRRVVFTGDSGFYPRKLNPDGDECHYDQDGKNPMLDTIPGKSLFDQYPRDFQNSPHLVIAHIGSIKEQEFGRGPIPPPDEVGRRFYPNHLGLLGTLMLLNALHPNAAVVSEFGAELKGFHIDLVLKLGKALNNVQKKKKPSRNETFVVVGDLTTVYDITNHRFLSHTQIENDPFEFIDVDKLVCRKAKDFLYNSRWEEEIEVSEKKGSERAYLFRKDSQGTKDNFNAKCYAKHFFGRKLPYQKNPVTKGEEL